jgi:excisionase family DNA binding protein
MDKLYRIGQAAQLLGVSTSTLRRWERDGKITSHRTEGKHRLYRLSQFKILKQSHTRDRKTIAYARVSSTDQKADLDRQKKVLEMYCASHGWKFELVTDLGSGMNYYKKGLKKLLNAILEGDIGRLVITHKDRLLRFGAELVFALCEAREVEVVIINAGVEGKFEEELAKDVLEIITVFSARLYGSRSRKNQKLLEGMKRVVTDAVSTQN